MSVVDPCVVVVPFVVAAVAVTVVLDDDDGDDDDDDDAGEVTAKAEAKYLMSGTHRVCRSTSEGGESGSSSLVYHER